jgi:hypothetical protein
MDIADFEAITKNFSYELYTHRTDNYILLSFFDVWDENSVLRFYLDDVSSAIEKMDTGFDLMIDMRQYRGSKSEYVHYHADALKLAVQAGLKRTAIVMHNNPMLKVTMEYVLKQVGLSAMFFDNMPYAERWIESRS